MKMKEVMVEEVEGGRGCRWNSGSTCGMVP